MRSQRRARRGSWVTIRNVVPLVSSKVTSTASDAIDKVNAQLSADDLRNLNSQSVNEQKKSADIAKAWLSSKGLI